MIDQGRSTVLPVPAIVGPKISSLALLGRREMLQQLTELLGRRTGVSCDSAHREGIDRVVARDGKYTNAVRHDDVLTLANDVEACFLERSNCCQVIDPRDLGTSRL
jgi:hypothetical protein